MIKAGERYGERSPARPRVGGEWGSWDLKLEDSPRPEVRALLEGGALRVGLGCGGDGGMGPTIVSYLRGAGAGAVGTVVATTAVAAAGMVEALWLAAAAAWVDVQQRRRRQWVEVQQRRRRQYQGRGWACQQGEEKSGTPAA